jgi:hypothetical protein
MTEVDMVMGIEDGQLKLAPAGGDFGEGIAPDKPPC